MERTSIPMSQPGRTAREIPVQRSSDPETVRSNRRIYLRPLRVPIHPRDPAAGREALPGGGEASARADCTHQRAHQIRGGNPLARGSRRPRYRDTFRRVLTHTGVRAITWQQIPKLERSAHYPALGRTGTTRVKSVSHG